MPKTYELAPIEVADRARTLIADHYPDLAAAGVTIEFVYARNPEGDAVTHQGYRALAVIKIVNLKDRAKGQKDAEVVIDAAEYEDCMSYDQQDALLDHELKHLIVARDEENGIKRDDLGRPKLKMRKHDYQMGWFTEIAKRHGMNSPEVYQARILWARDGQAFFPFAEVKNITECPGESLAEELGRNLSKDGVECTVSVSGDGPLAQVLNSPARKKKKEKAA